MKHFVFIVFVSLICIFPAKAQQFKVGILAGVNISDVDGADLTDNDNDFSKFGFTVGGYVNTKLTKKSTLQMEIALAQEGSSQRPIYDSATNTYNNYYKLRLNYIDVTMVYRHSLRFNVGKKGNEKFEIEGGLSAGYLFNYSYSVQSIVYTQNIVLNTTDVSALVGLLYNFTPNFSFDLRYSNSIIPVIKPDASNSYFLYYGSWNRGHNLVFQMTFRYTFGNSGGEAKIKDPDADNND